MCCGGSSPPAPAAPDYATIIPLQERSNLNQFNAMLNAQRTNSITPFGRQTWYRPGKQVPNAFPQTSSVDPRSVGGGGAPPPSCANPGDGRGNRGAPRPSIGQPGGRVSDMMYRGGPLAPGGKAGPAEPPSAVSYGGGGPLQETQARASGGGFVPGTEGMQDMGDYNTWTPQDRTRGVPTPGSQPGGASGGQQPSYQDAAEQGSWTMVQELDPREQWLRDQDLRIRADQGDIAQGLMGRVQDVYSQSVNFADQIPGFQSVAGPQVQGQLAGPQQQGPVQGPGAFSGLDGSVQYSGGPFDRTRAEDAIYNRQMRFAEPKMQQEEDRLHQRLVSQGFNVNSDAYREQMNNLREQQNLQRADQADRAILGGGQEASSELARILSARQGAQGERQADYTNRLAGSQFGQSEAQRLFGQGLASSQFGQSEAQRRFGNEATAAQFSQNEQQRRLADALQRISVGERDRGRVLNELNSFRTGQQVQLPSVSPTTQTPSLAGIDHLGLAQQNYSNQLGAWNAGQAGQDNMLSGLFGLAGSVMGGPLGGWLASQLPRR